MEQQERQALTYLVSEVAVELGVAESTVRLWIRRGLVPTVGTAPARIAVEVLEQLKHARPLQFDGARLVGDDGNDDDDDDDRRQGGPAAPRVADDDDDGDDDDDLLAHLRAEVTFLRQQLDVRAEEARELRALLAHQARALVAVTERPALPPVEATATIIEEVAPEVAPPAQEAPAAPRRRWWRWWGRG